MADPEVFAEREEDLGSIYVEAEDRDEAEDLATGIDLDNYENAGYVDSSFEIDSVSLVDYHLPKGAEIYEEA